MSSVNDGAVSKKIVMVMSATALLLLVPAVAMQVTQEVAWGLFDFVIAAVLLAGTGVTYVLVAEKVKTTRQRGMLAGGLLLVLLTIWAELAVGIFH